MSVPGAPSDPARRARSRRPLPVRAGAPLASPLLALLAAGLWGAAPTVAQQPRPEDVASIDGILRAYYEVVSGPAGEAPDAERDATLHHPDAWVAVARRDGGRPVVDVMTLDAYHGDQGPRGQAFWEWETGRVVRRSGNMVHVWSSYASARTPGGEPFATGVNSITLFDDGDRWWIMGWMFDASATPDATDLASIVTAREVAFARTMADRDFDAFVTFISPEAVFFAGDRPLRGRDAIAAAWAPFFEGIDAPFSWRPDTVEVLESGELALTSGPVRDATGAEVGRFNTVWRLDGDGAWRVVFDKGS